MAFIIKPLITEKMTNITEKSSMDRTYKPKTGAHRGEEVTKKAQPKYGFIVKPEANKIEIAKEVESLYNVTVIDVNTAKWAFGVVPAFLKIPIIALVVFFSFFSPKANCRAA